VASTGRARTRQRRSSSLRDRLGKRPDSRFLIIHADDLGMAHSVNLATFEALEKGWVTSASLLVPCPWFPEAAQWARAHPGADLGVHLALNSEWRSLRWGPISGGRVVPSLVDADGYLPLEKAAVVQRAKPAQVEIELRAQIDRARAAGVRLSHLDSHMGTLLGSPALSDVYRRLGEMYTLPCLLERVDQVAAQQYGAGPAPHHAGVVDGVIWMPPGVAPAAWRRAYEAMLAPLPSGVYQLIVHLAHDGDEMRGATFDHLDWGAGWRQWDFDLVRSPEFRDFLRREEFVLTNWSEVARSQI